MDVACVAGPGKRVDLIPGPARLPLDEAGDGERPAVGRQPRGGLGVQDRPLVAGVVLARGQAGVALTPPSEEPAGHRRHADSNRRAGRFIPGRAASAAGGGRSRPALSRIAGRRAPAPDPAPKWANRRLAPREEVVVEGDAPAVLGDLLGGQRCDVVGLADLAEEQLQLGDVTQLEVLGGRRPEPFAQGVQTGTGQRVGLATPSRVLHRPGQQPEVGQPIRLGVELGVREVPKQPDRLPDGPLEAVGRAVAVQGDHAENDVRRGGQPQLRHIEIVTRSCPYGIDWTI